MMNSVADLLGRIVLLLDECGTTGTCTTFDALS